MLLTCFHLFSLLLAAANVANLATFSQNLALPIVTLYGTFVHMATKVSHEQKHTGAVHYI